MHVLVVGCLTCKLLHANGLCCVYANLADAFKWVFVRRCGWRKPSIKHNAALDERNPAWNDTKCWRSFRSNVFHLIYSELHWRQQQQPWPQTWSSSFQRKATITCVDVQRFWFSFSFQSLPLKTVHSFISSVWFPSSDFHEYHED